MRRHLSSDDDSFVSTTCPHDCPSTCALEVEVLSERRIGRVRGAKDNSYTLGAICGKVSRYSERAHHPSRLTRPLRRRGSRGDGDWQPISWDDALDEIAESFLSSESRFGSESVWPYYYAGTMGLVMRDGIHRLRHAKRYSGMYDTICTSLSWSGYMAGAGRMTGVDPREMAESDLIVIWGTNPVSTQVNVMSHVSRARKSRGARVACVDVYDSPTMRRADLKLILRPGTDAALACAVMHVLFRDGLADREYLSSYADDSEGLESHLRTRTPVWASAITGLSESAIEEFASLIGRTPRTFFRLGYGFSRSRNGASSMHAALCVPTVAGSWKHLGGGAFHTNNQIYGLDCSLIEGGDVRDSSVRMLDQSRIGAVLVGEESALRGGPPVTAMLIQNTNPMSVCPDSNVVKRGFARDDLFVAVHEQFMTETARVADIVLPATMFVEHDDLYRSGGHSHLQFGPKLIDPPEGCRSNHDVIAGVAKRVGAEHRGFAMTPRELIDETLKASNRGSLCELEASRWIDCQPDFETAHFLNGFAHPDGKFRFRPAWRELYRMRTKGASFCSNQSDGDRDTPATSTCLGPTDDMPTYPDYWECIENADSEHPFRLATSPARHFLNSTFNETTSSQDHQGRPEILIHPDDLSALGIAHGERVVVGNRRGRVTLHCRAFEGVVRGVVIAESIWQNDAYEDGCGINSLTGADESAPCGGAAFHDNKVWIQAA